jgi:ATP-dependent phosphofructokinase / diphosphate-dependent phosphofructokinase
MARARRIGILTGGGDVPGLNSVIKSVTYRATEVGHEVLGIRRGWEGLTHVRPAGDGGGASDRDYVRPLDRMSTRTIDRTGGTVLHTSRTNPAKMRGDRLPAWLSADRRAAMQTGEDEYDLTPLVLEHIDELELDQLVTIGGDDTLSFSLILAERGVPLVAIPKTMDNDVQGTEYCIGFSSAITRAKELIDRQRTTLGSHERIGVFRIFGRDAGFSALFTAYVTSGHCVIPEVPYDLDGLAAILATDHAANASRYAFVITAEGAIWQGAQMADVGDADAFGHRHKANVGEALSIEIRRRTGIETVASELTYDLRSGQPDMLDQLVATTFANVAMDLLADGITGRMVAIVDGKYAHAPLPDRALGARRVDVATQYNVERFRPQYAARLGEPILLSTPLGSPVEAWAGRAAAGQSSADRERMARARLDMSSSP